MIEDEKKLVAEKLFPDKWPLTDYQFIHTTWHPQKERKWWDEIWDKMDDEVKERYMNWLLDRAYIGDWDIHTAKPEICWKALIKTLSDE